MTSEWLFLFAGATALSAVGFLAASLLWLRKLRETLLGSLSEAMGQQILTAQRLNEAIAQLQKQQGNSNQQIQTLAQAGLRLQQEITNVSARLDSAQGEHFRAGQTLH